MAPEKIYPAHMHPNMLTRLSTVLSILFFLRYEKIAEIAVFNGPNVPGPSLPLNTTYLSIAPDDMSSRILGVH
jgi:hypothetical protein